MEKQKPAVKATKASKSKAADPSASFVGNAKIIVNYVLSDNANNKRSFLIGSLTVFLVVMFMSLVQNALTKTGLIFLKLAEDQTGAFDLLLLPDFSTTGSASNIDSALLNFTQVNNTLYGMPGITGVAPRWMFQVNSSKADGQQVAVRPLTATMLALDTDLERSIGLAQGWPHRTLGDGEVHVSSTLLRALGVKPNRGDAIVLSFDLTTIMGGNSLPFLNTNTTVKIPINILDALPASSKAALLASSGVTNTQTMVSVDVNLADLFKAQGGIANLTCKVVDAIDTSYGKYPLALGNAIMMEKSFLQKLFSNPGAFFAPGLQQLSQNQQSKSEDDFNIDEYTVAIVVNAEERIRLYSEAYETRANMMIDLADSVMRRFDINYPMSVTPVVSLALEMTRFIRIFLDELFFTVLVVLGILSLVLVASLLVSDTEEKTFEYGMLRSLGFRSQNLVYLLIFQSFLFSLPGILVGLCMCYIVFIPIGYILSSFVAIQIDVSIDPSAIIIGVVLGLLLPVFGVIVPIRRALSNTIRDALDVYHNVVFETQISIQKLEDIGLNMTATLVAIIMITVGFMVYYLIPLSFALGKLEIFFRILNIIFLGMFLGQVFVSDALQLFLQRSFVYGMTRVFGDRKLTQVVIKNTGGHISRNRKTSIMFTLCLGFIIFSAARFDIQIRSFSANLEWLYGTDISVTGPGVSGPLPQLKLQSYLDSEKIAKDGIIVDYTFITYDLGEYKSVKDIEIKRVSAVSSPSVAVFGMEKKFFDVIIGKYSVPSEINWDLTPLEYKNDYLDLVAPLFSSPVSTRKTEPSIDSLLSYKVRERKNPFAVNNTYNDPMPILISESLRDSASIDTSSKLLFTMKLSGYEVSRLAQPVAMLKKFPSFPSISRLIIYNSPVMLSMDRYLGFYNEAQGLTNNKNVSSIPKGKLLIKVKPSAEQRQIESVVNALNNLLPNDTYQVQDLHTQVSNTAISSFFLLVMFYLVSVIGVVFCFFVLFISFTANIRENSWELGVLRAIGLTNFQVTRIYIYEAVSIVLSSLVLGLLLGVVTSVAVALQSNLFDEMPFEFLFPTTLFVLIILSSLALAIVGSYAPIQTYAKKPIAVVLKG